jgi:hypothetical protein
VDMEDHIVMASLPIRVSRYSCYRVLH